MANHWFGYQMTDPNELESRFSQEDGLAYMDSIFDEPSEETLALIERIKDVIESLPAREADFVDLYYFRRKKQTDIATMFGVSQPTVCYRLQRATARIQFLLQLPDLEIEEIAEAMEQYLSDPLDAQIMVLMYQTTCQSEVAKRLAVSQGLVRHRFIRSIARMHQDEQMHEYADLFEMIAKNLNILREVRRSSKTDLVFYSLD